MHEARTYLLIILHDLAQKLKPHGSLELLFPLFQY